MTPAPSLAATTTIRRANQTDYEPLLAWLNGIFHPKIPDFFQTEYCHVFHGPESILETSLILEEGGEYLAHVSLVPLELRTSLGILRVGAIGMVAVDPKARGRGLMRLVLEEAHQIAREEGCALAFLGGIRSLYTRFGYEICGLSYEWMWDRQGRKMRPEANRLAVSDAAKTFHPLWIQKPYGILWRPEAFSKVLERPHWEVWTAAPHYASYAVIKREEGRILMDVFLGDPEGFCPLMDSLDQHEGKPLHLRHSAGDAFLHSWMENSGMDIARKSIGMLKILNIPALEKAWGGHSPPILQTLRDGEPPSKPQDLARQRQAVRSLFGDPFDGIPKPNPISWSWETISYV